MLAVFTATSLQGPSKNCTTPGPGSYDIPRWADMKTCRRPGKPKRCLDDCALLVEYEERLAREIGADIANGETFGFGEPMGGDIFAEVVAASLKLREGWLWPWFLQFFSADAEAPSQQGEAPAMTAGPSQAAEIPQGELEALRAQVQALAGQLRALQICAVPIS
ncbi:unnamed protein product [Symbiodinium natans]|uniref:Uncharacterized protein n=1 Tax=Symbiodinium natans TaxID=878477 RepID=A0A812LKK9_9DINO|nr:unnamed protein product [Symbiodinium natans]